MSPTTSSYSHPVRIYFEDTDAGGVVYHGNYLKFFERARTEWMRSLGYEQRTLSQSLGILFVVGNVKIRYLKPAHLDDALYIVTRILKMGNASMTFLQECIRDDVVICRAEIDIVCVSAKDFKPAAIPTTIKLVLVGETEQS